MALHLALNPQVVSVGLAVWNGVVNAFNSASGRTMQQNLEGQRLAHQTELQERQIASQLQLEFIRTISQIRLQQDNQQFQKEMEFARQEFQGKIVEYQCQENRKLQEFIKGVDIEIAKSNRELQVWLFQQQKQSEIELAQYNRETQFLIAVEQRETALEMKELDKYWPLKNHPRQMLESHQGRNPVPIRIIIAPPKINYGCFKHLDPTLIPTFPDEEVSLSQCLKSLLPTYYPLENEQRPTELIDQGWEGERFAGGSAVISIFSRLKSEPIILLQSQVIGNLINLHIAYWSGGQDILYSYKMLISNLNYRAIIYEFAIQRALLWETNVKEKLLARGKTEEEINERFGKDNASNLSIYREYQELAADGIEIESHYKINSDDVGKFLALLGAYHNIIAALYTDIHYLITTNLSPQLPELLPKLEREFSIGENLADDLFQMVVENYIGSLRAMEQDRSELVPEFAADIAFDLTGLSNSDLAEKMLDFALESWLNSRYISVENGRENFEVVAKNLLPLDEEFVVKVNRCLVGLGKEKMLSVIESCYRRGIKKFNQGKYEEAIIDFGYVIDFDYKFIDAYYRRGLSYLELERYQEAVEDLTEVIITLNGNVRKPHPKYSGYILYDLLDKTYAPAYNYRGNAYFKLGKYQQALDDYEEAISLGVNEAVKNRDIALSAWEEVKRQEEQKSLEARLREDRESMERFRILVGSLVRNIEKKAEDRTKGEVFTFEVVTVNKSGKIINRTQESARQKIEDLGNGIKLEMVYIPAGRFLMGSPETEAERNDWESPQHYVDVPEFFMGKYPVTQAQWQAVMKNNPSGFKGANRPVENVSGKDATEFCQKLSEITGKKYSLPSESQWEYACRSRTSTPFYFGETITSELANYDGSSTYADEPQGKYREETTDVGIFPPNSFGLYDMHGNVWEWCADEWHDNYEGAPTDGSVWLDGNKNPSPLRGGSWINYPYNCRSACRLYFNGRGNYGKIFGFRIVCSGGRTL